MACSMVVSWIVWWFAVRLPVASLAAAPVLVPAPVPSAVQDGSTLQVSMEDGDYVLRFASGGAHAVDLLAFCSEQTGTQYVVNAAETADVVVRAVGEVRVPASRLRSYVESLLGAYDIEFRVLRTEDSRDVVIVRRAHSLTPPGSTRTAPRFVEDPKDLDALTGAPGETVVAVVPLRGALASHVAQVMASTVSDPWLLFTADDESGLIVLRGPAPLVAQAARVARALDRPPEEPKLARVPLRHVPARDAASQTQELLSTLTPGGERIPPEDVRIVPDVRTNSVLLLGTEGGVERARAVLAELDVEAASAQEGPSVRILRVDRSRCQSLMNVLTSLYPQNRDTLVAADRESGSIVLWGPKPTLDLYADVVQRLLEEED